MQKKSKKKAIRGVTIFFIVIVSILVLDWLYLNIIEPTEVSYSQSCDIEKFLEEFSDDYVITGTVTVSTNVTDGEVTQEVESINIFLQDEEVIKHEWVHIIQVQQNRVFACENKILRRLNEAEAYIGDELPNPIFNLIYGQPKI